MPNTFIRAREWLLNGLLRVSENDILNPNPASATPAMAASAGELAVEMKQAMNRFKAQAMDERGARVDYERVRTGEAYRLFRENCTPKLHAIDPATLKDPEERLAFWINLYNALSIDAIIQLGVRRSVMEGWLGALRFFRRAAYRVGGHRVSAEDIEHGILRGNRGHPYIPGPHFASDDPRLAWMVRALDPRIHMALNCGGCSCPPIAVYDAARIDAQLDMAASAFVFHSTEWLPEKETLRVSSIFKWYAQDFGGRAGVIRFIIDHLPEDDQRRRALEARAGRVRLTYAPYDWRLNDMGGR